MGQFYADGSIFAICGYIQGGPKCKPPSFWHNCIKYGVIFTIPLMAQICNKVIMKYPIALRALMDSL